MAEAEARILAVEEKLDKTESALASATKLVYLEAKMDDLENRARRKNIQVFGLKEGTEEYKCSAKSEDNSIVVMLSAPFPVSYIPPMNTDLDFPSLS
ncbi:hypothetical protein MHYP_G00007920 [Metynnis hypsauchen]